VELVATGAAVPSARHRLRGILREWGVTTVAEDAELVVSEIVANAVNATQAIRWPASRPPVRLWTLGADNAVSLLVWDAAPGVPVQRMAGSDAEDSRGLVVVSALSAWGYYLASEDYGGKVVWSQIPPSRTPNRA
jgi:anti-sigma regulatory factor (Ser/Thr protein kinase)